MARAWGFSYCPAVSEDHTTLLDAIAERRTDMVERLVAMAEVNTGSFNLPGLAAFETVLLDLFSGLGDTATIHPLKPLAVVGDDGEPVTRALGNVVRIRCRPDAPRQMLLVGHYDTVFDPQHVFQSVSIDGDRMNGPGVADMKGGILVLRSAVQALEASPLAADVGWEILFNPDEELGSVGSADMLAAASEGKDVGFIFEPSFPNGDLAGARKGSGTFTVVARGRAAHAGRDHHLGRNAIAALARATAAIDELNARWPDVTINVGYVSGGTKTNIVPDIAVLKLNVRAETAATAEAAAAALADICKANESEGITLDLTGGFTRFPKPLDDAQRSLLNGVVAVAAELGMALKVQPTGGVSDGNNLYAAGLPNVDNLGVHGGNIHSEDEFVWTDSLVTRSQVAALTLLRFADRTLLP